MAWTLTEDLDSYLAAADDFLRSRPVGNTIQLSVLATIQARGQAAFGSSPPLFGWWCSPDGSVDGAFLVTPPYPALLARLSAPKATSLAEALSARGLRLAGVNSEQGTASSFAAAWAQLTGTQSRVSRRIRLFRLQAIVPPSPWPPGSARVATEIDRELLESWFSAFHQEIGEDVRSPAAVDDRLSYGGLTLWESRGAPVSLAGITRTVAGVARVGPVYTPPDQRKRGYGAAVTAAVSLAALDAGAQQLVLFTDLANPTSNALYPRLGYRPVEDSVVLSFTS
jgi:predicted GNAT family acetyltransferase